MIQRTFIWVSTALLSIHGKNRHTIFSPKSIEDLLFFFCMLTFFRPPCLKSKLMISFFMFVLEGHRKDFCILFSSLIISAGTFDINERKTIFEISQVLKTIILLSSVRRRIRQTFKTFRILVMLSRKFFSFRFSLLCKKWISIIFMVSLHKSLHFMP